jgi:acyl-CoA dehydrogenase
MNTVRLHPYLFEPHHADLAERARAVAADEIRPMEEQSSGDEDAMARSFARALAASGLLRHVVSSEHGGVHPVVDIRSLCLIREALGWASGFADTIFAMQGLGSFPITLAGSSELRAEWLPGVVSGDTLAAFALTEENAGSDVGAMQTTAVQDGDAYVLNGEKKFISNAGVAGLYVVFAVTDPTASRRRVSAFVVSPDDPGFEVVERQRVMAPHPIGRIALRDCRVDAGRLLGSVGDGMRIALGTLDRFRATVGAAALGMGQRALDEMLGHTTQREQFGAPLFALQAVQLHVANAATDLEGARMLVYDAAWNADQTTDRMTLASAMGKLSSTEAAFRAIDSCVQVHGGEGVLVGSVPERLYREIRALRIYEGASDVQRVVIARHVARDWSKDE